MKVTIIEAAKLTNISRQHLYRKYINTGTISTFKENNKCYIDISELIRIFPNIKLHEETNNCNEMLHEETVKNDKSDNSTTQESEIITLLKNQLTESKEREKWLIIQIDELRHQQSFLLENKTQKRKKFLGIF
jgi:hypothetical protein